MTGLHGFFTSIPNRQLDGLATGPDQVWVGDITYLKVAGAWRYLAVVMDRYSRRVLGWSLGPRKDARLTLRALNHAVEHRRPRPGVILHSDRGVEYAAYAFRTRLATLGFVQSMNRPREVTDNTHSDVVHGNRFRRQADLERLVHSYMPYYNGVRLHSGIGHSSPSPLRTGRSDYNRVSTKSRGDPSLASVEGDRGRLPAEMSPDKDARVVDSGSIRAGSADAGLLVGRAAVSDRPQKLR